MAILGTTKLNKGGKITLIQAVQDKLGAKVGDIIVFESENDKIFVRRG